MNIVQDASMGSLRGVIDCLNRGVNINVQDGLLGDTALIAATRTNRIEIINYLLTHGANPDSQNEFQTTAFITAAQTGNVDIMKILRSCGADIYIHDKFGYDAIMTASSNNRLSALEYLINEGFDVNSCTKHGENSLRLASSKGYLQIMQLLVANGANINANSKYGTAAEAAAGYNHIDAMKYLIEKGADFGNSIIDAALSGHLEMVELLINKGANINTIRDDGTTAIMLAARNGELDVVKYLVANNADISYNDTKGKTAMDYASEGNEELRQCYADRTEDARLMAQILGNNDEITEHPDYTNDIVMMLHLAESADEFLRGKDMPEFDPLHITIFNNRIANHVANIILKGELYDGRSLKDLNPEVIDSICDIVQNKSQTIDFTIYDYQQIVVSLKSELFPDSLIQRITSLVSESDQLKPKITDANSVMLEDLILTDAYATEHHEEITLSGKADNQDNS